MALPRNRLSRRAIVASLAAAPAILRAPALLAAPHRTNSSWRFM